MTWEWQAASIPRKRRRHLSSRRSQKFSRVTLLMHTHAQTHANTHRAHTHYHNHTHAHAHKCTIFNDIIRVLYSFLMMIVVTLLCSPSLLCVFSLLRFGLFSYTFFPHSSLWRCASGKASAGLPRRFAQSCVCVPPTQTQTHTHIRMHTHTYTHAHHDALM